jgi:putative hemolysin
MTDKMKRLGALLGRYGKMKKAQGMSVNVIVIVALALLVLLILVVVFVGRMGQTANVPNPASKFCLDNGGTLNITTNEDGSQTGYCTVDGKTCEEWSYKNTGVC